MLYYFDDHGYLTSQVLPERCANIVPPAPANGKTPNWTGDPLLGWVLVTYTAPPAPPAPPATPQHATKRAFQNRFPKMANGISTKYDAMCMFLTDDGYAASLGVTGSALYDLRMLITTGTQRMNASPFVDMAPTAEAAALTGLLMQGSIPAPFRLSASERTAMLDTPLADTERYAE
jgi:hypothetical protein